MCLAEYSVVLCEALIGAMPRTSPTRHQQQHELHVLLNEGDLINYSVITFQVTGSTRLCAAASLSAQHKGGEGAIHALRWVVYANPVPPSSCAGCKQFRSGGPVG